MQVQIDNVWCTPSTMHVQVTVWGPNNAWRHKYYPSIPLEDLEPSAIEAMLLQARDEAWHEEVVDIPLF